MNRQTDKSTFELSVELKRRKREILTLIPLSLIFLVLTWVEFQLFGYSQNLPFYHSIFFFGLVNFNIVILLLLLFLIFRNVVKVFAERQGGLIGSTLKGKLIAAFVGFSTIPTVLMFLISVFYINSSFDKWFNEKISGVLKNALAVTNAYVLNAKKKNYYFANEISTQLSKLPLSVLPQRIKQFQRQYLLDAVEYYPDLHGDRVLVVSQMESLSVVPRVLPEFLQKGITYHHESSMVDNFADGNLVRVIVPMQNHPGALVVSSYIPMSLLAKIDDITGAYENFRDLNPIEYPVKSIYLIILVLMTLVILMAATWFGFYLARQLSIPLEELNHATRRLAKGDYTLVKMSSGSKEINHLITSFNSMTRQLEVSEKEVLAANRTLKEAMERIDEHSKYIEVVLSNASTGVISVDQYGKITMVNRHAAQLLEVNPSQLVGKNAQEVLSAEHFKIFDDLLRTMKQHQAVSIQKEVKLNVRGRSIPLQMTLSVLHDDHMREWGKVIVFDDLTPVLSAQRSAAWTEVARRIAHEIKNPLTPIKLAAQRLNKKFSHLIEDPAFSESIHMIINQVDDMKNLVDEFSSFARMPKSQPILADLNRVSQESLALFKSSEKEESSEIFEFFPDAKLPCFYFDPDQLKRAITNLLDNAISATKKMTHPRVKVITEYESDLKIARLTVADNGEGIHRQLRNRIFEPYVTTKEQGTGLGLAIVKRTIEDHNGFVRALPNLPRGTKFVIELPVIEVDKGQTMVSSVITEEEKLT